MKRSVEGPYQDEREQPYFQLNSKTGHLYRKPSDPLTKFSKEATTVQAARVFNVPMNQHLPMVL